MNRQAVLHLRSTKASSLAQTCAKDPAMELEPTEIPAR